MAKRNKDREFVIEFLQLYREYPALWKIKSTEYSDRNLKDNAYKVLIEKYKEIDPKADKETVKKKINSLRTNYRKELTKVKASYKSGTNTDDIYVPALWYFNELNFLQDQYIPKDECSAIISQNEEEGIIDVLVDIHEQNVSEERRRNVKDRPKPNIQRPPGKKQLINPQRELLNLARDYLQRSDEYEHLGITWANELKKMSPDQQIQAKKAIHDILYEGQLGTLHRHSVKINELSINVRQLIPQSKRTNWSYTSTPLPSPQSTIPQINTDQSSRSYDNS
ncbi:uncharacterized protein [Euwallacea fornicatus]|uniref:uncharacterized protein isoform X1 n=1 Tax=Euwallacea fornicatus TaxID=995702 RepID=UPI00338F7A53